MHLEVSMDDGFGAMVKPSNCLADVSKYLEHLWLREAIVQPSIHHVHHSTTWWEGGGEGGGRKGRKGMYCTCKCRDLCRNITTRGHGQCAALRCGLT